MSGAENKLLDYSLIVDDGFIKRKLKNFKKKFKNLNCIYYIGFVNNEPNKVNCVFSDLIPRSFSRKNIKKNRRDEAYRIYIYISFSKLIDISVPIATDLSPN